MKSTVKILLQNRILVVIFLLYFISRAGGAFFFIPHNDEVNYAHIAMKMARDWEANRYLSVNGELNYDYKMPLQFWANSLTINLWKNPLVSVRLWSILMGFCGLFFTQLLVAYLWNKTAALWAAGMIVVSEYYLYFDSIGLTEAFLYGLGAAYLFFLYYTLLHRSWLTGFLTILFLSALLISKSSGTYWLLFACLFPWLAVTENNTTLHQIGETFKKECFRLFMIVLGTYFVAKGAVSFLIPDRYDDVEAASFQKGLVRSFSELLEFPFAAWIANLKFYGTLLFLDVFYWLVPLLGLSLLTIFWLWKQKNPFLWRYLILIGICLTSFLPLVLIAKGQAVRYFGMGLYFFYIPNAIALYLCWEKCSPRIKKALGLVFFLMIVWWKISYTWKPLINWGQTDLVLKETPPGWANGAGIMKLLDAISKLAPGVMLVDSQWGFPLTAIQIFYKYYPQLDIHHLNPENLENLRQIYQQSKHGNQNLYFVADARKVGDRPSIDKIINTALLCTPKTIIQKKYQDQTFEGTSLVICQAKAIPASIKVVR
ncbi:MAG: glycosyltransferase family 39 protein [SAR324 cluster bacterium]|nr:glycosyltransferase family 39 protein [SAR324 cluster bacterium]